MLFRIPDTYYNYTINEASVVVIVHQKKIYIIDETETYNNELQKFCSYIKVLPTSNFYAWQTSANKLNTLEKYICNITYMSYTEMCKMYC